VLVGSASGHLDLAGVDEAGAGNVAALLRWQRRQKAREGKAGIGASVEARHSLELLSILVRHNRMARNSRACEPINAECLATELLPCECVMRRPIASLCSAPMGLGFDPDFDEGNVGTIVLSRDSMKK